MKIFNPLQRTTYSGQIAIALYRIGQAINHLLRERSESAQLSPAQIQALIFLKYARPGVRTIGGLADRLVITDATASGVCDALERKRLVERSPLAADRRTVTLTLTTAGEQASEALEDMLDDIERVIQSLPKTDQEVFYRATQAIVRSLQEAGHVKVYEMCWGCQFFRRDAHPEHPRGPHHCAFVDAPLPEPDTYLECPDFLPLENEDQERR